MASKKLVATYAMMKAYKSHPTNKWLTLSEFIDNSISSWRGKGNTTKSLVGLEIKITFDSTDENNLKLIISDNANGMNEDEILEAMQPSDRRGKKDTHYNQYGVGMKLGIFWYGEDGIVHSKVKGKKEFCVELKTSREDENTEIEVKTKRPSENYVEYESGTTIRIEKIYDNRKWKPTDLNDIKEALGWRYGKMLSKNLENNEYIPGMTIKIRELLPDRKANSSNVWCNIESSYHKAFTLQKYIDSKSNKNDYNMEKFNLEWENDVNKLINNNSDKEILVEFCNLLINKKELKSTIDVSFDYGRKNTKLIFGILSPSKNYAKISGVTTFHLDRAINHSPNSKDNKSSSISFKTNKSEGSIGDSTDRRLFGEIDLTGIEVPDQNKSSFLWSFYGEDDLNKILEKVWNQLKPLLNLIIYWEKLNLTQKITSNKEIEKILDSSSKVLNPYVIEPKIDFIVDDNGDETNVPCYLLKEDNKRIWIEESLDPKSELVKIESNDEGIKICYNAQHKFWKPFINDKDSLEYRGSCIYPIILLIGLCNDYFNKKELTSSLLKEQLSLMDFEEVINKVVKVIESKDE